MAQVINVQSESKVDAIRQLQSQFNDATMTVGAETANVITVAVTLKVDPTQTAEAVRKSVLAYVCDDANGDTFNVTAVDGGVAVGTNGIVIPLVASKAFMLVSESNGRIDVALTHAAGAKTVRLVLVMPSGRLVVSGAITFA